MSIIGIILATIIVGATGLIIGVLLGIAGEKLKVEVDERELFIRDELPGNNCGGCGFAGCDALAKAIANGEAEVGACPVGGSPVADKIAAIMGVAAGDTVRTTAFVKCIGTCDKTKQDYEYTGVEDCKMVQLVPGSGPKSCKYGCMGYGSCVKVCPFDAIHIIDGIAKVDKEKCKACGKCIAECPNHIIELVPYEAKHLVQCSSKGKGKDVMQACSVGCIACKMCEKVCEFDAIHVVDNIAHINYEKCTYCGKCAEKCPKKIIL